MQIFSNNSEMGEANKIEQNKNETIRNQQAINEQIRQCINRKTKRGRKSKNELPREPKCEICLEFSTYSQEHFIKCSVCWAEIHPSCYKEQIEDVTNFICERCQIAEEEGKDISYYHCSICDRSDGILYKNNSNGEFFHEICIRFIPELYDNSFLNLNSEILTRKNIRRWRYKNSCKYCREKLSKKRAVIKCSNPRCKCYYHIPCAIQKQMIFSLTFQNVFYHHQYSKASFPFFCSGHNKKISTTYRKDVINQGQENLCGQSLQKMELSSKDTEETTDALDESREEVFNFSAKNILHLDFDDLIKCSRNNGEKGTFNNQHCGKIYDEIISTPKDKMLLEFDYSTINELDFDSFPKFFETENFECLGKMY